MTYVKVILIGLMSISLMYCSSAKKQEAVATPTPVVMAPTPTPIIPTVVESKQIQNKDEKSTKELEDLKASLKKAEEIVKKDAHKEAHAESHARKVGPTTAEKSLGWLKNGNVRFMKGLLRKDGGTEADVERLSTGQTPHAVVLSCSDSRVPPELVFDQKLGELFVVRTAGQSLDNAVIASVEYAVEHLGANLVLVMGHSSCGAVKASFEAAQDADTGSPYINALIAEVQPRIADRKRGAASENFVAEGWDNAQGVAKRLLEKSKIVREAAKSGSLRIEAALYHLKSGQVEWRNK